MPQPLSATATRIIQATAAPESPIVLLELHHALLPHPLRLCSDVQDIVSNGASYRASAFRIVWPDDQDGSLPRAQLQIDNTTNEVGKLLERTDGAHGGRFRVMMVFRSSPDVIERERWLDFTNVVLTYQSMTCTLGYEDILNKPSVPYTYRENTAPGIF